jgi:hypothetical protein
VSSVKGGFWINVPEGALFVDPTLDSSEAPQPRLRWKLIEGDDAFDVTFRVEKKEPDHEP